MKRSTIVIGVVVILFTLFIFRLPFLRAVNAAYDGTIRIVNSSGTVLDGVASATTASYDGTVRVVDSSGHVIDAFSSGPTTNPVSVAQGGTGVSTTSQNFMFAGPTSGSGAPGFRLIVTGDIATALTTPGPIGGTTSSTGQFTKLCVGTSPCTLPSTTGDENVSGTMSFPTANAVEATVAGVTQDTSGGVAINSPASKNVTFYVNGVAQWAMDGSGNFAPQNGAGSTGFLYLKTTANGVRWGNSILQHYDSHPQIFFDEGLETSLAANESLGTFLTTDPITVENIVLDVKRSPTCSVSEQITCFDCGTTAGDCTSGQTSTILSAVTIASGATRQSILESVATANVAAGHYVSCLITAGTCTLSDNAISMTIRAQ